jgi:hypothetical protein
MRPQSPSAEPETSKSGTATVTEKPRSKAKGCGLRAARLLQVPPSQHEKAVVRNGVDEQRGECTLVNGKRRITAPPHRP